MFQGLIAIAMVLLGFAAVYMALTSASVALFQFAPILPEGSIGWGQYMVQGAVGMGLIVGAAVLAAFARARGRDADFTMKIGQIVCLFIFVATVARMILADEHGLAAVLLRDGSKEIADFWLVIASVAASVLAIFLIPIFRKAEARP